MNPRMISQGELLIAGVTGDGSQTGELWQRFMELDKRIGLKNKVSDNGYEVRIYSGDECKCHVGVCVSDNNVDSSYTLLRLPASAYAAFKVYVAQGYDSQNDAMDEWLRQIRRNTGSARSTSAHTWLSSMMSGSTATVKTQ